MCTTFGYTIERKREKESLCVCERDNRKVSVAAVTYQTVALSVEKIIN